MKIKLKVREQIIRESLDKVKLVPADIGRKVIALEDHYGGHTDALKSKKFFVAKGYISRIKFVYDENSEYLAVDDPGSWIRLRKYWAFYDK
jgi:hypothetical protein